MTEFIQSNNERSQTFGIPLWIHAHLLFHFLMFAQMNFYGSHQHSPTTFVYPVLPLRMNSTLLLWMLCTYYFKCLCTVQKMWNSEVNVELAHAWYIGCWNTTISTYTILYLLCNTIPCENIFVIVCRTCSWDVHYDIPYKPMSRDCDLVCYNASCMQEYTCIHTWKFTCTHLHA